MKQLFYLMIFSFVVVIGCADEGGKKFFLPSGGDGASVEGTAVIDSNGNVIVADNTGTTGSGSTDTGATVPSGSGTTTTVTTDTGGTTPAGGSGTGTTDTGGTTPSGSGTTTGGTDTGSTATLPQGDPVDDLTGGSSTFAAYDIHDAGGIIWIKNLYKNGKAVFAWEFPPSITLKVQSIEPRAKVLVTFYGVYTSNETKVFYQYTAQQQPMKDIEVDETKWVVVGGKDLKFAYIQFTVIDENGNDISATTKAKINVHLDSSALTASLLKAKNRMNPLVMGILIGLGLVSIVGINIFRRRRTA